MINQKIDMVWLGTIWYGLVSFGMDLFGSENYYSGGRRRRVGEMGIKASTAQFGLNWDWGRAWKYLTIISYNI